MPNTVGVAINGIDLSAEKGRVAKCELGRDQDLPYSGDATSPLEDAPPVKFLNADPSADQEAPAPAPLPMPAGPRPSS
jgi:hypothetical protein